MSSNPKARAKLIRKLETIYSNYDIDLKEVKNTSLWDLEKRIGADHFRVSRTKGRRGGYQPRRALTKEEIIELNNSLTKF
jgi:hypothetical protein